MAAGLAGAAGRLQTALQPRCCRGPGCRKAVTGPLPLFYEVKLAAEEGSSGTRPVPRLPAAPGTDSG